MASQIVIALELPAAQQAAAPPLPRRWHGIDRPDPAPSENVGAERCRARPTGKPRLRRSFALPAPGLPAHAETEVTPRPYLVAENFKSGNDRFGEEVFGRRGSPSQ
jgi:hypothetical protein